MTTEKRGHEPAIRISTLGTLQVIRHGEPVRENAWRTRQARQVLKILLTERPRPVATDRLIDILWPGSPPGAAATTLRSAINALRNVLEPERPSRAPSSYIHTQAPGYAFRPHPDIWLDVDAFEEALDRAQRASSWVEKRRLLEEAAALYRDDYLISDPYADWARAERERLRERYFEGLLDLAGLHARERNFSAAVSTCRRVLARDPVRESAYQALMRYQAESGDSAAALLTYERCRTILGEELGADPSPTTRELHSRILNGAIPVQPLAGLGAVAPLEPDSPLHPPAADGRRATLPQQTLLPALEEAYHSFFVGREDETATMAAALDAAMVGRGSIVVLAGETGVGKTRLAYHVLQQASEAGATVISAACQRLERGLPYAPLADGISRYLQLLPDSSLRRLPQSSLAQLAQILPSLQDRLRLPASNLDSQVPEENRQRLIDGMVAFLVRLAQLRPLVLFLDDLHWADADTLAVLSRLSQQIDRHPILLLLAYRHGDLAENDTLRGLLHALRRSPLCRMAPLERLRLEDVRQLVYQWVGRADPRYDELARSVYGTTLGNALFVTEALKALQERAQTEPSIELIQAWRRADRDLERLSRSERVQEIIRERIDRLPEAARAVLQLAAVIGRDFSFDLLELAASVDPAVGLDVLLRRQFLLERLDERLDFVHRVVRQVAYAHLNTLLRRRLHRRVADALVELGNADENPAEAAFHYGQAGAPGRLPLARYSIRAGEQLLRTFSLYPALAQFGNALESLERAPNPPADLMARAFTGMGLAYESLLDPDGVTATYSRLRRWALERGDRERALMAHTRLTTLLGLVGQQAESNALMAELIGDRDHGSIPALVDLNQRRRILFRRDDEEAEADWSHFRAPPPVPGDPVADITAALGPVQAALPLLTYGWALQVQGQFEASARCLRAAVELSEETGQLSLASLAYHQLAVTVRLQGDAEESHRLNQKSKAINHQVHGTAAELASLWPRISSAFQALASGDLERAETRLRRVADFLAHRNSFRTHRNSTIIGLGLAALGRGEMERASALLEEGLADPENRYPYTYVKGLLGLAQIAQGRRAAEQCAAVLRRALAYAGQRSLVREFVECVQAIVELRPAGAPLECLVAEATTHARQAGLVLSTPSLSSFRSRAGARQVVSASSV